MALGVSAIVNAMTVDVEDYFHVSAFDDILSRAEWDRMESRVCRNTERLLELFDEFDVRATFFVLGWVAERFPELVKSIASRSHEIASHGYAHHLVYEQTPAAFQADIRRAKEVLESAAGVEVVGYRAPSYSVIERSLWALDILAQEGYRYDASIFPIHHDRYGMPDAPRHAHPVSPRAGALIEVPASTVRVGAVNLPIAGGAYFRILPYGWTRWGIARVNRLEAKPVVFYIHPWEIDANQPRFRPSRLSRFRHYRNLAQTEGRLRRLFSDFSFGPVNALLTSTGVAARTAAIAPLH